MHFITVLSSSYVLLVNLDIFKAEARMLYKKEAPQMALPKSNNYG